MKPCAYDEIELSGLKARNVAIQLQLLERIPDGQAKHHSIHHFLFAANPVGVIGGICQPQRETKISAQDKETEIKSEPEPSPNS